MDIALDESKLKVQIEFSVRVQCGWYRGFYFDNFRPGILKYPGAFLFLRDIASEIPQGYTRCRKKHGISGKGERKMELVKGVKKLETLELADLLKEEVKGQTVKVNGAVHTIRDMGTVAFVILRKRGGLVQCVYEKGMSGFDLKDVKEAATVEATGVVAESEKAPHGIEIRLRGMRILSEPAAPMPLPIAKWKLNTSLEAKLNYRPISLRNLRERARFRIQEGLVRGFRDFLYGEGFTEIHTPKIGAKSAEGGANLFRLDYFHRPAILQQSPQFYKQMMVGVFDRVFETAPVFRAEKHNTKRHLNEYTSLDFEMGYIDGFEDVMAMETGYLQYTMKLLEIHRLLVAPPIQDGGEQSEPSPHVNSSSPEQRETVFPSLLAVMAAKTARMAGSTLCPDSSGSRPCTRQFTHWAITPESLWLSLV